MHKNSTKKGVVSLYIVIFATILFGVVTLSFMRIIVSEAGQSSESDLSRSAYDSAMAGVEDAKTAVKKYYQCLSRGLGTDACQYPILFKEDCEGGVIGLAQYVYGYTGGEVKIQQTSGGLTAGADNESDQAYTCVILRDHVPDYRGTLTSDTRTKLVPIRIQGGTQNSTGNKVINRIQFQWFSGLNEGQSSTGSIFRNLSGETTLPKSGDAPVPPAIQLAFIKVANGANINLDSLRHANNNDALTYSTLLLFPNAETSGSNAVTEVSGGELWNAGNISGDPHTPTPVTCNTDTEFACTLNLTSLNISSTDTVFLVVSLPYGDTISDFAVSLYDSSNNLVEFSGVQISVDSTGRTNQLVRRVESRLDPADLFFPYPQYEIETNGTPTDDALHKYFWITANCWHNHPTGSVSGTCDNNKEL